MGATYRLGDLEILCALQRFLGATRQKTELDLYSDYLSLQSLQLAQI